jgi:hypothetical protein
LNRASLAVEAWGGVVEGYVAGGMRVLTLIDRKPDSRLWTPMARSGQTSGARARARGCAETRGRAKRLRRVIKDPLEECNQVDLARGQPFDEPHRPAAARARPRAWQCCRHARVVGR